MRILLALLLIAAPVSAEEIEARYREPFESTRKHGYSRQPDAVALPAGISTPRSTNMPATTRTRRVRLGRNGRVTVGY